MGVVGAARQLQVQVELTGLGSGSLLLASVCVPSARSHWEGDGGGELTPVLPELT